MNDNGNSQQPGSDAARAGDHGGRPVPLDQGHIEGTGGIPQRFADPGLPAARAPRWPTSTRRPPSRAERQVATLFVHLDRRPPCCSSWPTSRSPKTTAPSCPASARDRCSNLALGVTLAVSLLGIGLGAVHWAKTLMPDEEVVEERHPQRSSDATAQAARRRCLRRRRGGPARPPPADQVHPRRRARPVRRAAGPADGRRPRPAAAATELSTDHVAQGPAAHARPRDAADQGRRRHDRLGLPRHARGHRPGSRTSSSRRPRPPCCSCASTPADLKVAKARDWGYQGIVAYSKICTHVGCPVGLYEQQTHHLLCPCHQSTFDVTRGLQGDLRPGQAAAAAAADHRRQRGIPGAQTRLSTKPWARASGSVDEHHNHSEGCGRPAHRRREAADRPRPGRPGRRRRGRLGRRPHRRGEAGRATCCKKVFPDHWSFMLGEIAMYSLVILLLTGHVPDVLVRPERRARSSTTAPTCRCRASRCPRPTGPTLDISFDVRGGLIIRQIHHWAALLFIVGDHGAHVPGVLHRRVPQAARDQLGDRHRCCRCSRSSRASPATRCPDDLLSGTGLRARRGLHAVDPGDRLLRLVLRLRRRVPGRDDHPPPVHRARAAAAGHHRRPVHRAHPAGVRAQAHPVPRPGPHQRQRRRLPADAGLHRQGRRLLLHRLRRHRRSWRRWSRSTRSGCTARTTPPRSRPAPSPTGTWASPTAPCAWSPGFLEFTALGLHVQLQHLHPGDHADPACSTAWPAPTRSSRPGSPATSASTTCSTARATPRPAPGSASWRWSFYCMLFIAARQRHHRHQAAAVDQRHHQHAAARLSSSCPRCPSGSPSGSA